MKLIFENRNITISGGTICYYVCGNQESKVCMVFLNGLYHGKEAWVKQQRNLSFHHRFKMIFIDYRGAGESQFSTDEFSFFDLVNDIRAVIEVEKPEKTIVVGYSVGGMVALYYSYLYQKEIAGMILLNTGISINIYTSKMLEGLVSFLKMGISLKDVLTFIIPWNHSAEYLEKINDFEEMVRENYNKYNRNTDALINFLKAIKSRPNLHAIADKINLPVLLIGSKNDYIFPERFQIELNNKLPQSSLKIIENCGHSSFIEKDIEVNTLIDSFLHKIFHFSLKETENA